MVVIVDTCSLVELSRYYLPFDGDRVLFNFMESQFVSGEIILLDCIFDECKNVSDGLAIKSMPFLDGEIHRIDTGNLFMSLPKRLNNLLDNQFCVQVARKRLTDMEYSVFKEEYLKSGDGKVILYLENLRSEGVKSEEVLLVTEETRRQNDGKPFKKLPLICEILEIKTMNIVNYLKSKGVDAKWVVSYEREDRID